MLESQVLSEDKDTDKLTNLDTERAFNIASTDSIARAVDKRQIPQAIWKWIGTSLKNRTIIATLGKTIINAAVWGSIAMAMGYTGGWSNK